MWVGTLWLVDLAPGPLSFDLLVLSERLALLGPLPTELVWLFAAGFMVRMAAFPLHTWFPAAVSAVPTSASVLLVGGVLPLAGFGIVHVLSRLLGPAFVENAKCFVWMGLVTAVGGGLASLVQRDIKRLFAFVCLAQMGLALCGLMLPGTQAQRGGLLMLVAVGLGGACLFIFGGVVCQARGSQRLVDMGGLWRTQPLFAGLAFAGVATVACMPATVGFVGAVKLLVSSLANPWVSVLIATSILICGSSVTWAYRRMLGGVHQKEMWSKERWPRKRQMLVVILLAVTIVLFGLFPGLAMPASGHAEQAGTATPAVGIESRDL
jgi:NADH-quinone oxidoreductase subunit M